MFTDDQMQTRISKQPAKHGEGQVTGNPKLCLYCRKPIHEGEAWTKHTSLDGAYSIAVHDTCTGKAEV